jgi:molybdopterin converting factor small subunit
MEEAKAKVKIRIPQVQRKITNGQAIVDAVGGTVAESIDDVIAQFPELEKRFKNSEGKINKFLLIFLNDEDVRYLEGDIRFKLKDGDVISLVPAMAGG